VVAELGRLARLGNAGFGHHNPWAAGWGREATHTIDAGHGFMKGPGLWECSGHVLVMPLPLWKLKPITDGASRLMGNACPMDPISTDDRSIVDSGKGDNGR